MSAFKSHDFCTQNISSLQQLIMIYLNHTTTKCLIFIGLLCSLEAHLILSSENLESENEVLEPVFEADTREDASVDSKETFIIPPAISEAEEDVNKDEEINSIYDSVNFDSEVNGISANENQVINVENESIGETPVETVVENESIDQSNQSLSNRVNETENAAIIVPTSINETVVEIENVTANNDAESPEVVTHITKVISITNDSTSVNQSSLQASYSTTISSLNVGGELDSNESSSTDSSEQSETGDEITEEDLIDIIKQEEAGIDATFKRFIKHLRCLVLVENTDFLQEHNLENEVFPNKSRSKLLSVKSREQKDASEVDGTKDVINSVPQNISNEESTVVPALVIDSRSNSESQQVESVENASNSVEASQIATQAIDVKVIKDSEANNSANTAQNEQIISTEAQIFTDISSSAIQTATKSSASDAELMGLKLPTPGLYWKPLNFALLNQSQVLAGFAIFVLPMNATSLANAQNLSTLATATVTPKNQPTILSSTTLSPPQPAQPAPTSRPSTGFLSRWNFTSNFFNRSATTVRPLNILLPFRRRQNQNRTQQQQQRRRLPWRGPMPGDVRKIDLDIPKSNSQSDYYADMIRLYNNFWVRLFGV